MSGICDNSYIGWICSVPDTLQSMVNWRPVKTSGSFGCNPPDLCQYTEDKPVKEGTTVGPLTEEGELLGYTVYDLSERPTLTWYIYGIYNCDGTTKDISGYADFGLDGQEVVRFEPGGDGKTLTAVITHQFNLPISDPIPVYITGNTGETLTVYINPPNEFNENDPCVYNSAPYIAPLPPHEIEIAPPSVYLGEFFIASFPMGVICHCDQITCDTDPGNNLAVNFLASNGREPESLTNDGLNYYARFDTLGWAPGYYTIVMKVTDGYNDAVTFKESASGISVMGMPPLPVLSHEHNPSTGTGSGYHIDFDASGSYSPIPGVEINTYEITYGDGPPNSGPDEVNSTGIFHKTYPNPGAGNTVKYNVFLRIIDEYEQENSTSIEVTVWGDSG